MSTMNKKIFNAERPSSPSSFSAHGLEHLNKILTYNDKKVRIFGTNEDPWFCGKDVCDILEYSNYKQAISIHIDTENKKSLKNLAVLFYRPIELSHNEGQVTYINEEGLWSLIFACTLPSAKLFKKWVVKEVLPSIRKTGQYKLQEQLADVLQQLEIKEQEKEDLKSKLRSETLKLREQLRKTLEFNQATNKVEPSEYIYVVTTAQYQRTNKFKVGGCQSFELVKSRLTQYNSGESDTHNHFFVYLKKTVSHKSIEHAISGMLMGFRENKSKELYFIHFDWLVKCLDAVLDGSTGFLLFVNENRERIVEDTINLQPTISPPIQLEQIKIAYLRAGDEPREVQIAANKLDDETIESIREAIESYQSENNIVVRSKFEEHLKCTSPSVKLEKKRRDVWKAVQQIGAAMNPMWRYKY